MRSLWFPRSFMGRSRGHDIIEIEERPMPFDQIGILIAGAALIAALVVGAIAAGFGGAVRNALVIWVLFLLVWYMWGPPLPYSGNWASLSFAAVSWGIGLCIAASVAHWVRHLVGRGAAAR
jgi:hypothetical protein